MKHVKRKFTNQIKKAKATTHLFKLPHNLKHTKHQHELHKRANTVGCL